MLQVYILAQQAISSIRLSESYWKAVRHAEPQDTAMHGIPTVGAFEKHRESHSTALKQVQERRPLLHVVIAGTLSFL